MIATKGKSMRSQLVSTEMPTISIDGISTLAENIEQTTKLNISNVSGHNYKFNQSTIATNTIAYGSGKYSLEKHLLNLTNVCKRIGTYCPCSTHVTAELDFTKKSFCENCV